MDVGHITGAAAVASEGDRVRLVVEIDEPGPILDWRVRRRPVRRRLPVPVGPAHGYRSRLIKRGETLLVRSRIDGRMRGHLLLFGPRRSLGQVGLAPFRHLVVSLGTGAVEGKRFDHPSLRVVAQYLLLRYLSFTLKGLPGFA